MGQADDEFIEVLLTGLWLTQDSGAQEGVFLTVLPGAVGALLVALWQTAQLLAAQRS
ncbi:hypothetical protein [Candidatus Cyanaurora vandensis]|uniref:hypothetical protein n=1 Tax=Candidatus Cyanaurora vandensis TaxID=2714958 RepID=UPI00258054FE|nr:hypothetical protein [Candidatus Cyanaurora vandensis]